MSADLQALERFVVDNDDLLELEQHIGRFNIFDALRIVEREVKHSDFLAWLVDPNESHGQGGLFLRAILMDLFKMARETGFACPVSPIELDGEELRGVEVRREWRNIDLLIRCDQPCFVVAIENKIRSGEHSNQLARYREIVEAEFGDVPSMYVFLTVEGDEPSEEDWVPYSYGDLYRVLTRLRKANETSIGDDVRAFLDHYLRLIRGRLMDDPKIADLCQRIYKNHRQALQLIYEHAGSPAAGLLGEIEGLVAGHAGGWHIVNKTSKQVSFVPKQWLDLLPAIGARGAKFDPRCWIVLRFEVRKSRGFLGASVWPTNPTKDQGLRQKVIQRLTGKPKEFGFRLFLKTTSDRWSQLGRESIGTWSEEDGPDEVAIIAAVEKKLDELVSRLAGIPSALRPIIDEWEKLGGVTE
ncbi:MAG: PD-(D/E)XK nuclease family protein [Planctomycetaceae bacterium]|nr:PD-(D/E)XK nuclease family protein [Planctomycetaceae bacterium]